MDFKTATDRLTQRVTADEIAMALGSVRSAISHARLDPSSATYRSPPKDWQPILADLALKQAARFRALADELGAYD